MWREDVESIKALSHRLSNILVIAESGMNRIKNANNDTVGKRWGAMIDAIIVTERNRISKEIELYPIFRTKKSPLFPIYLLIYTQSKPIFNFY